MFGVFIFFFDTLPCQNYFFQGVWGVYKIVVEIPEGWGGGILVVKNWKFRGGGKAYVKFPPWWGYMYGYFLELRNYTKCRLPEGTWTLLLSQIDCKAGTTAEGQNLLANISTSRASLLQGQYLINNFLY